MAATPGPVLVPTTLFVCDFTPQKIHCDLPPAKARTYSSKEVEAAVGEDLHLPLGHFRLLADWQAHSVGIFVHPKSVGCSKVKPRSPHENFRLPTKNYVPFQDMFRLSPDVRVGYSYLTGYDVPYKLSADGKLKLEVDFTLTDEDYRQKPRNELERTAAMLVALQKTYANEFLVHYPQPSSFGPLCPFSGGGDIFIARRAPVTRPASVSQVVVDLTGAGEEEKEEEGKGAGGGGVQTDLAGGLTEKFSDIRSEEVVLYQLQANMLVQCASNLQRVLQVERTAHNIQAVTCYGMHCGGKFPLKILKLTVDFTNKALSF